LASRAISTVASGSTKNGVCDGFSKKYKTHYLVYQEFFPDIESAIAREKQLKGWS
jgi:putative endonuclease